MPVASDKLSAPRTGQMRGWLDPQGDLMQRTLIALAATLALAGGSAFAQQRQEQPGVTPSAKDSQSSGGSFTERVKETARKIGEKTREVAGKAKDKTKDKTKDTAQKSKDDSDQKSAQSSHGGDKTGKDTQSMG